MRLLMWNLFHGRARPERPGADLTGEFAAAIAGWDWDVALLQEVLPWWPPTLAAAAAARAYTVLTSRNGCLPLRRAIAVRRPDLIKSHGGGANAILVRDHAGAVTAHARRRLRLRPERRLLHAVALRGGRGDGLWIGNVHAQAHPLELARADLDLAGATLRRWSGDGPAILGGDCNVSDPVVAGFTDLGGHRIDRALAHGPLAADGPARTPPRSGGLSDHAPVLLDVVRR